MPGHEVIHYHLTKGKNSPKFINKIIYFVALVGPLLILPQAIKVWYYKSAEGLSLFSWVSFLIITLFWLWYGITHREKPIIFAQIMWLIIHFSVVMGIIWYG